MKTNPPSALTGLSGLAGYTDPTPEATAEERLGGTADPRHSVLGEVATPYPWEVFPGEMHGPYGIENDLLGFDVNLVELPGGQLGQDPTADHQPITHGAPTPRGVPQSPYPDDQAEWRAESVAIHAEGFGASREMLYEPTLEAQQDQWVELKETDPGITFPQMVEIPDQVKTGSAGWGSRDRVQSNARQNEYGFDAAHMHRRYATGSIPGNYMWMQPGSRPLLKSIAGTAKIPVGGTDTPFSGDIGLGYDSQGSALAVAPAAYQAPPEPVLAQSYPSGEAPVVELW